MMKACSVSECVAADVNLPSMALLRILQCLTTVVMPQANDLEKAVELLGQALQTRISAYGGDALQLLCYMGFTHVRHWQALLCWQASP